MAREYTRTIPKKEQPTITSPKGTPDALQAARDRCKARGSGWVWDEAARTCTRVSNKPVGAGGSIDTEEKRQAVRQVGDTERQLAMVQAGVETSAAKALEAKLQTAQSLLNVLPEEVRPQEPVEEVEAIGAEQTQPPTRQITQEEIDLGLTQADIDSGLSAASAGGVIPVEPLDLVGGFGKGVVASIAAVGTKGGLKAGAPTLFKKAKGALTSPAAIKKISKTLRERLIAGVATAAALGTGAIVVSLTGADVKAIEQEVTKYGEQLTKIPEAAKQGLSLEDGELVQYPIETAIQDVQEVMDTLDLYETELQGAGIGNTLLRLTGRYDAAQIEIDKQRLEARVAMGKLLQEQIAPSDSRINAEEVFNLIELQGLVRE